MTGPLLGLNRHWSLKVPAAVDPYGVSKLAAEQVLKILSDSHGIEYNIAVPHNIIGPKQKYDDPYRSVVSIMINLMLQKRRPIIYGDGKQTRNFSDIDDCIYCLDKLIRDKKIKSEIFNIDDHSGDEKRAEEVLLKILAENPMCNFCHNGQTKEKRRFC